MTVLSLGQARAISEAAEAWPQRTDPPADALVALTVEAVVQLVRAACVVHDDAWGRFFRGEVKNPQAEGKRLREVLDLARKCVGQVQDLVGSTAGAAGSQLQALARAGATLDRLDERFREGWPYLPPEELAEIEQARQRPASEYLTLKEFARGLATPDQP